MTSRTHLRSGRAKFKALCKAKLHRQGGRLSRFVKEGKRPTCFGCCKLAPHNGASASKPRAIGRWTGKKWVARLLGEA